MDKLHELKIDFQYWKKIIIGEKTFEVRFNDRDYQVGDHIRFTVLIEGVMDSKDLNYYRIDYILDDEKYVKPGYVIMAISLDKSYKGVFNYEDYIKEIKETYNLK